MSGAPRTDKARATRERIVLSATQLVSTKGYFHTTVDDILAATRLTKGGFYAHFDSKEALGRAVIDHAARVFEDRVLAHVQRFADPRDQLHALLEAYRLYAAGKAFDGGCFFVNLATEVDDQHDEFARRVEAHFAGLRAFVAGIVDAGKTSGAFRADTPSEGLAAAVLGYLHGTMMQAKVGGAFELFVAGNQVMHGLVDRWALPKEQA